MEPKSKAARMDCFPYYVPRTRVLVWGHWQYHWMSNRLPVSNGFIGCIRRFVANEHEYKFEDHPLGDVTRGFDIREYNPDVISVKYEWISRCHLSTAHPTFVMLHSGQCAHLVGIEGHSEGGTARWLNIYSGSEKHGDFIALSLSRGFVEFTFDLGSGPAIVRSEYPLTIGQWHTVKVSRTARLAVLKVDKLPEVMTISSNGFWHLSLPENVFLGGVNHEDKLPLDLKSKAFFVGCIQKIDINGRSLSIVSEALGVATLGIVRMHALQGPVVLSLNAYPNGELRMSLQRPYRQCECQSKSYQRSIQRKQIKKTLKLLEDKIHYTRDRKREIIPKRFQGKKLHQKTKKDNLRQRNPSLIVQSFHNLPKTGTTEGEKSGVTDTDDDDIIYPDSRHLDDNYYNNVGRHNYKKKNEQKKVPRSQKK
ncbi:unnamed protein product [Ceratitis capitata]|uniref:(Mediterranean fruit fly) hypothetical protein n=1 Tax=Ceratitis capitata TaxID=7213 RepID=A0A811VEA3_CERCA|nr:unnamed protein product [Ceratitis capitata]